MPRMKTRWWDIWLSGECRARVNASVRQFERMKNTCFRSRQQVAGNFALYTSPVMTLSSGLVCQKFRVALEHVVKERYARLLQPYTPNEILYWRTIRLQIECPKPVGWESTVPQETIPADALELFKPNRHSKACSSAKSRCKS